MDQTAMFNLVVQAQSTLPRSQGNQRSAALLDAMRRQLGVVEEPFTYTTRTIAGTPLAPAATQNTVIQIQADADFKILSGAFYADIAAAAFTSATQPIPNVTVLLTDTGNGRQLMDNPLPIQQLFGTGLLPYVWTVPKMLAARSTLQVQFTNFDAAASYNIRLAFNGVKLYPLPS
jgi:hypothetical protein